MFDSDKIWRCDCGDNCFLTIKGFDPHPNDPEAFYTFDIEGEYRAPNWRSRFKQVFRMLRRGRTESYVGVLLNRQTATEIRDELTRLLVHKLPPE